MSSSNRTRQATTADRIFVADLVEKHGLGKAAEQLGLSKLATLNAMTGRGLYGPTIRSIETARTSKTVA
jgi:hypothetical protein